MRFPSFCPLTSTCSCSFPYLSPHSYRGGGRGHSGRGGPGVNQAGQGAPFQCKHTLDGTCSWGPSRCRYVHGVDFHANGVDLEAHKGAIRGLASDANCLYTFGEDGIIKTYSWTPGRGVGRGGRGRPSSDIPHGARRWHIDAGMVGMFPLFPTLRQARASRVARSKTVGVRGVSSPPPTPPTPSISTAFGSLWCQA